MQAFFSYAIKDVTEQIMSRVDCPFQPLKDEEEPDEATEEDQKYKIAPRKDLQSKFLAMMKQRELDKVQEEEDAQAEVERQRILVSVI